jgi:recombination protein RecA
MAKNKENKTQEQELDFFARLAKDIGGDLLNDLDKTTSFIDTGILAVNFIISGRFVGGGFPSGAMHEVSGESASGKSLLGTNFLRGCQTFGGIPIFHDAERAVSKDFAIKASHVDPMKMIVTDAPSLESSFNKLHRAIRLTRQEGKIPLERPICIVYDSIAVSPSEREVAQTTLDMESATQAQIKEAGAGVEKPGERAKICSAELRKLMPVVKEQNVNILYVNQLRKKIGVMFGDDRTTAGGGESLKYYCSTRLYMHSFKQLKDERKRVIGMNVTIRNIKSRYTSPFQEAKDIHLFFDKGIDPFGGLLELMLQIGRVEGSGGNYKIAEPWAGGKTIKFKSSKEANTIPVEALLECPGVVDATSVDQIKYYSEMFGAASEAVAKGGFTEEDVKGEE